MLLNWNKPSMINVKSFHKMSISLLRLLVGHDGPTTKGLNLRSLGFGNSIYSDFCVSSAFLICLDFCILDSPQLLVVCGYNSRSLFQLVIYCVFYRIL